jgi:hypothetical protein
MSCSLCERPFPRERLTRHHCLPRSRGGTSEDIALLCPQCHGMVHATYTNGTLAVLYPTAAKLREAPELEPFLRWVRKQPPSSRSRNRKRRQRL